MSFLSFVWVLAAINCFTVCEMKFTTKDLSLIRKYFVSECVVFVEDSQDVGLINGIKSFSRQTYFTVVNSSYLGKILSNNLTQLKFLQRRTTIVTKEDFNVTSFVNKVSSPHYLTWVIFRDHSLQQGLYIPVNSEVYFVQLNSGTFSVEKVYHLRKGLNAIVTPLRRVDKPRTWTSWTDIGSINLQGISVDVYYLTNRSACRATHRLQLLTKLECVHWDILELMGDKLNFSLNGVECTEKRFPFAFPNGTDSEFFTKLKYKQVDFTSVGYIISARGRRYFVDFVWPTFIIKSMMYLKQGKLTGHWLSYLKPMDSHVWWGILIYIIIFGVLLHIFEKSLLRANLNFASDLMSSILKALQVFCNQAIPDMTAFISIRMIYFFEFFIVLFFFQAYCGYLVSSLTVISSYFPFFDLRGFFATPEYQLMTLQKGFHQFYYRKIIGVNHRENFMLPQHELPDTVQGAIDKLCLNKNLAFAEFREDLLDFDVLRCRISELPKPVLNLHVGITIPRGGPLKEHLKRELWTLRSSGILQRFSTRFSSHKSIQDKRSNNDFTSVGMAQVFSIFILLGFGIMLSVVILICEGIYKGVRKHRVIVFKKKKKK